MEQERQNELVGLLRESVDMLLEAVGSGRLGFDAAVAEYAATRENVLSQALKEYVERVGAASDSGAREDARRAALRSLKSSLAVPEVSAFVDALLESHDQKISLVKTLEGQAQKLAG